MMVPRLVLAVLAAVVLASCRDAPPTPAPGPGDGPQQVTGDERLGWDQPPGAAGLSGIRFAVYVDDVRSELTAVSCGPSAGTAGFPCSGRLPPLSPGAHTLELASFIVDGNSVIESARSEPLQVVATAGAATTRGARAASGAARGVAVPRSRGSLDSTVVTTIEGARLRVETLAEGLNDPTDLAFGPGDTVWIAERAGRVLLVRRGGTEPQPVLEIDDLVAQGQGELLALSVDPGFENTGFLYALYTAAGPTGATVFRIARFREAGELFAQQVVILDDVAASPAGGAASLRFGPDGKLYAALGAGLDPQDSGDLASFSGKVLRLNGDGTTPRDQRAASPVHAYPFQSPVGMAWHRSSGVLWIAEGGGAGASRLTAVVADGGKGSAAVRSDHELGGHADPTALAVYEGALLPMLRDNLLVASADGGYLVRLRVDPGDPARIAGAERLLEDVPGGVRVVAVGFDGAIYFCTARTLARLVPANPTGGRQ